MGMLIFRNRPRFINTTCFVMLLILVMPSSQLLAQERSDQQEDKVEGRVIYSRDVPYGSAIGPRTPSTTHSVVTGPTNMMLKAIATGLEPLGDEENAGVVADTTARSGFFSDRVLLSMGALNGPKTTGPSASQNGSVQASIVGNAVGQATGAIQDAMGSLRNALGGGK